MFKKIPSVMIIAALQFTAPLYAKNEPQKEQNVYVLSEYGKVATISEAEATLNELAGQVKKNGGGFVFIDNKVCSDFTPKNNYQKNLDKINCISTGAGGYSGSYKDYPTVSIIDMRKGYIDAYLPQYGGRSTLSSYSGVFAPLGIHREINLPGESMDPAGAFPIVAITNNMVKGTVNFRTPIMEKVEAGSNVPMYFASTVGLWEGAKIASERLDGKSEVITVKKILWDGQKKQNYILTDVTRPYPAGSMFTNKSITPGLNMVVNSNSDNQTNGHIGVFVEKNSLGDEFLFQGMLSYSSDVSNAGGDEGGVVFSAEVRQNLEAFTTKVKRVDRKANSLYFETGPKRTMCYNLSMSRPVINLNQKKWVTEGNVVIVASERALNDPINKIKNIYKGKRYPDSSNNDPAFKEAALFARGGLIEGSADTPWNESIVGRYFALNEPDEYILGEKDFYTGYHYGPRNTPVYRWYQIVDFKKNSDNTKVIKIRRTFKTGFTAGSPILINQGNYTYDGHLTPLKYIIAPGAEVFDISEAWQDARNGYRKEAFIPKDSPQDCLKVMPNGDAGTPFDFEPGDQIVQAVGSEPWTPRPIRIRMFNHFPSDTPIEAMEVVNYNTITTTYGINFTGKPMNAAQIEKRKDKRPAFLNGIYFHESSSVGVGMRFAGYVKDAAMLMDQKDNNYQPIIWKYDFSNKTTSVGVNPRNGNMELKGGNFSMENGALLKISGISSTDKKALNLRGINIPVNSDSKTLTVNFKDAEPDDNYSISIQPNWPTMNWTKLKTAKGFTIEFSAPAPEKAVIDWQLIR